MLLISVAFPRNATVMYAPAFVYPNCFFRATRLRYNLKKRKERSTGKTEKRARYVFLWLLANFWQTMRGPFSAVSKPILQVNTRLNFESSWRDLQDVQLFFTPFESNLKTAPNSKIRRNFVKHFRIVAASCSNVHLFWKILSQFRQFWWNFSSCYRKLREKIRFSY